MVIDAFTTTKETIMITTKHSTIKSAELSTRERSTSNWNLLLFTMIIIKDLIKLKIIASNINGMVLKGLSNMNCAIQYYISKRK